MALRAGVSPSRRMLALVMVLSIPGLGPILAVLVRRTRGQGPQAGIEEETTGLRRRCAADERELGDLPPLVDRIMSADPAERLAALRLISTTGDAASIAILRWAVEHGSLEVVLDAALTLEELDLRRELLIDSTRTALEVDPTFEHAVAAADAAAHGVRTGLIDCAGVPALAEQARGAYDIALSLAPQRRDEVLEQVARLELASGRPRHALAILTGLLGVAGALAARLQPLHAEAAFAARCF